MSDRTDTFSEGPEHPGFEELRGHPPPEPFAPAETVRRRGRRRSYQQAVLTAVAVLVTIGVGAGGAVAVSGPSRPAGPRPPAAAGTDHVPTATPSAGTPPTTAGPPLPGRWERIPPDWFLTVEELGPGQWGTGWDPERFEGPPRWLWADLCATYRQGDYPSLAHRIDQAGRTWTDGPPPSVDPGSTGIRSGVAWVDQVIELFPAGLGATNVNDIRTAVDDCGLDVTSTRPATTDGAPDAAVTGAPVDSAASPGDRRMLVVESGFAGDQSMLVELRVPVSGDLLVAVVRVGDVVTTLRAYHPDRDVGRELLLRLATRAAARLP